MGKIRPVNIDYGKYIKRNISDSSSSEFEEVNIGEISSPKKLSVLTNSKTTIKNKKKYIDWCLIGALVFCLFIFIMIVILNFYIVR